VLDRIDRGDLHAMLILRAMCYNVAKEIGAMATALRGDIDAILITGGVAHSKRLTDFIASHIDFIAPIYVYPGENELEALAQNALGVLTGELEAKVYVRQESDDPASVNDMNIPSRIREWLKSAIIPAMPNKRRLSAMRQYLRKWRFQK
jgi:glycerol kinase